MSRKTRRPALPSGEGGPKEDFVADELLTRLAQILVHAGYSPAALAQKFALACEQLKHPAEALDAKVKEHVARLPDVLALWHTERDYIDSQGDPLPLSLRGRGNTLSRLILRVFPGSDPETIVPFLLQSKAVRRQGRWFHAVTRHVSFAENFAHAQIHSLDSVCALLRTVQHNVSCEDAEQRLLERSAVNHSVPVRVLPAIHRRLKWEIGTMVNRIDDYMRDFQVAAGSEPTTTVRLGVYASEDPQWTASTASRKGARVKKREKDRT